MASQFDIQPVNVLQALMAGRDAYGFGDQLQQQRGQRDARKMAEQSLLSGENPRNALARLIGAGDAQMANTLSNYQNNANSVYGTPIYGTGPNGETRIGSFNKQGTFVPIETPGFTPSPGIKTVDTGTGTVVIGSRTGQPIGPPMQPGQAPQPGQPSQPAGYIPKDVQGEAQQKRFGQEVGERQAGAGQAKAALETSVSSLDRMADVARTIGADPSLGRITGIPGMFPNIPGGGAADVQAKLENLKTQVAFGVLQAMREASKTGGALGAVSDRENTMLSNALASLDRVQSVDQMRAAMQQIIKYTEGAKRRLQEAHSSDYANLPKGNPQEQRPPQQPGQQNQRQFKTIGGKRYYQENGQWFAE